MDYKGLGAILNVHSIDNRRGRSTWHYAGQTYRPTTLATLPI